MHAARRALQNFDQIDMVAPRAAGSSSGDPPLSFRSNFYRSVAVNRPAASNVRRFDSQPAPGSVVPAGSAVKPYNGQDYHTTFARRQGRVASSEDFLARLEAVERREAAQGGPPVQASRPKAAQDRAWKPATPPARSGSKPFGKAAAAPQEEKKGFFESLFSGWGNSDPEPAPAPAPVPTRARRASKERVSSPPAPRASPLAPAPAPAPAPPATSAVTDALLYELD